MPGRKKGAQSCVASELVAVASLSPMPPPPPFGSPIWEGARLRRQAMLSYSRADMAEDFQMSLLLEEAPLPRSPEPARRRDSIERNGHMGLSR